MIDLKVGDEIYYTGDMANMPSFGRIIAYHPRGKYTPEGVDIEYDEERFEGDSKLSRLVPTLCFSPGPGRRFWLKSEWIANRRAAEDQYVKWANAYLVKKGAAHATNAD